MHIVMFRSIIDLNNEHHNLKYISEQERDSGLFVNFDPLGRAVFGQEPMPSTPAGAGTPLRDEGNGEITLIQLSDLYW